MSYKGYLGLKASQAAPLPLTAAEEELKQIKLSEVQTHTLTHTLFKESASAEMLMVGLRLASSGETRGRDVTRLTKTTAPSFRVQTAPGWANVEEQDVDRDYSHTFNIKSPIFLAIYGFPGS